MGVGRSRTVTTSLIQGLVDSYFYRGNNSGKNCIERLFCYMYNIGEETDLY